MIWNTRVGRLITASVVLILLLNPEWIELALFIDAIGLDLFLLLVEVQIMALSIAAYERWGRPLLDSRRRPGLAAFSLSRLPGPVGLMHLLVVGTFLGNSVSHW